MDFLHAIYTTQVFITHISSNPFILFRTVQVRHLCFGWNHPQFASALLTLASVLGAIGNEYDAEALMKRQVCSNIRSKHRVRSRKGTCLFPAPPLQHLHAVA